MRRLLITFVMLSSAAVVTPASALQANDTMNAWKSSSEKDRAELLEQILGKDAASAAIAKCMNETSKTPGHTDLQIDEVAKVCASSGKAERPV